jgi:hypothetical protein
MAGRMIWHDTRLSGQAPNIAPNTYTVNDSVDLNHAIGWIAHYARSQGGLDELLVMCHGKVGHSNLGQQMSMARAHGGFGLQICREGINLANVSLLRIWNPSPGGPMIRRVTIYACGTAETAPGNEGTRADGARFMGEFAMHSGAYVIAGRDTQTYNPESVRPTNPTPIDFGEWEGPVFLFNPNDGRGTPFSPGRMA